MQGPFNYEKRERYAHLTKGEAEIWERYVKAFPNRFDEVYYDVELGLPIGYDPERPEPWKSHASYLGGYKIDVLGIKGDVSTIIEIKKMATTKALGEVWLYEYLYKAFKKPIGKCELEIVTDFEMPHMREVCEADNVKLIIV